MGPGGSHEATLVAQKCYCAHSIEETPTERPVPIFEFLENDNRDFHRNLRHVQSTLYG